MAADWFSSCQAPVVLKCVQKVDSEFAVPLSCCPAQLFVKVSTVEPFLHTWIHAMGDTRALLIYSIITKRSCWTWWGPVICTTIMLLLSCAGGLDLVDLCTRGMGRLGEETEWKHFLTRPEEDFKKRRRVKTMRRSLIIKWEFLFSLPVGIWRNSEAVCGGPCMFCSVWMWF